ncbi:MAG: lysylphosphatidylglycerol synthase transmembrane domain-containing protein [Chloroflexia bacterium]
MKRILFLLVGILVSVVSLYFAFQGFDLGALWDAMGRVQLPYFLLLIVPYILTFMTKVWRWRTMFHPDENRVPPGLLFSALMISYIPLPFRAGEVARGVVVSRRSGVPAPRVFSTIVVEKVLDVLTLLLLLGISLPFIGFTSEMRDMQGSAVSLGVVVLAIALVLLVFILKPDIALKIVHLIAARLPSRLGPRIESATEHALQGLAPLSNPAVALRLGLWSLATWGINAVTVYLMLKAFNVDLIPFASTVLLVTSNLSMVIPAAPGSVGTFELAVVTVLKLFGIEETRAQAFAIVYHFVGLVPVALIGVFAAIQQGTGMAAFRAKEAAAEPPVLRPAPTRDEQC